MSVNINKKDIAAIVIFVALIAAFVLLVNSITVKGGNQELEMVRDAVKNSALTCYAVEGMYPAELDYLQEHYNLSYNEERYKVYYEAFASNIMPYIKVVERGAQEQ